MTSLPSPTLKTSTRPGAGSTSVISPSSTRSSVPATVSRVLPASSVFGCVAANMRRPVLASSQAIAEWKSSCTVAEASVAAGMRLAKHLAHAGVASRRAAEAIVAQGRVTVDDEVVTDPARDVTAEQAVAVDGAPVVLTGENVVWAVHKPMGVVSTAKDTHGRPTVVQLVDQPGTRLYPVGRLGADTPGLILLTDDGAL